MIKIGLTGGIGSGKSLISGMFESIGVYVYNSDIAAKQLYYTNTELKTKLIKAFGKEVYFESGSLNKKYLSKLIFEDKSKLSFINNLIHPLVNADFEQQISIHKNSPYIVKESAILIESKAYNNVDKIIVVSALQSTRIERVCKRDNVTRQEVMNRINNQLPDSERLKYADFVINNNDNQLLIPQILKIHNELLSLW